MGGLNFKSKINRRLFLKSSVALGLSLNLLEAKDSKKLDFYKSLEVFQLDLFPAIKELKANSLHYMKIILNHSKVEHSTKSYIIGGMTSLNNESIKLYKKPYIELSKDKRDEFLVHLSKLSWGRRYMRANLAYILESALGDPVYGINQDELGWKWLNHQTGLPQPTKPFL